MQKLKIEDLITKLRGSNSRIYYKDLMKSGFNSAIINQAVKSFKLELAQDKDGYTIIIF